MKVYAVAGSRSLPFSSSSLVSDVCHSAISAGSSLVAGCCIGADQYVIDSCPADNLRVFCAFDSSGAGACSRSAVSSVQSFVSRGGSVSWLAGGSLSVPLIARLSRRTVAVVSHANAGVLLFVNNGSLGSGSSLVIRTALSRGLRCFVFGGDSVIPNSIATSIGGFPCRLIVPDSLF